MLDITDELVESIRLALEDQLVERRDARISIANAGNGLVIREPCSTPSAVIRISTPEAVRFVLEAYNREILNVWRNNPTWKQVCSYPHRMWISRRKMWITSGESHW